MLIDASGPLPPRVQVHDKAKDALKVKDSSESALSQQLAELTVQLMTTQQQLAAAGAFCGLFKGGGHWVYQ